MKKKIIIKVFSAFAGFDTQFLALRQYARWYNQNTNGPQIEFKLVGWCEIDKDAITSHNALFPEARDNHYPDITKIDWVKVPDFDVLIYSSCCQSLTRTGAQRGMTEGSGTPSSLIWYLKDAIKVKVPKICILENVPPLIETKFEGIFEKWRNAISRLGYRNTWSTMCAADYGIPQNRNRAFLVSVKDDIKKSIYFPEPIGCMVTAEKLLESEVAEKYYFSEVDVLALVLSMNGKKSSAIELPRIHNKGRCIKKIITPSCQDYDIHVCPTLVADKNYGKCSYKRFLSTSHYPRPGVLEIWHATERVSIPYKEIIMHATFETNKNFKIINDSREDILKQIDSMRNRVYFRLRRLTPRECFRLMSVEDSDINKLVTSGVPEDQLYKMAGNAIVIKVLYHLYTSIFDDVEKWWKQ